MRGLLLLSFGALVACEPKETPDASYRVTITGETNSCTTDTTGYQETLQYDVYYDPEEQHRLEIRIDDTPMALGAVTGCTIDYETSVWLEERGEFTVRWMLEGTAVYQTAGGGCLSDEYDWEGTETITVTDSTDPSVLIGCTYTMSTLGTLVQ